MNRNRFRLVFSHALRMMVPVAETARSHCKAGRNKPTSCSALALIGVMMLSNAQAEIPVASANFAAPGTTANYQFNAMQAWINQVGNKAVVNFDKFNISAGYDVRFQQVDSLAAGNLVPDASFSVLGRIQDNNPSIIAGSISQGAGQKANVILVNSNGIAFLGGSQVNLNSFTASTLNIQDNFLDNFLPGTAAAQFENALDGSAARGFIKVFEGARITAGSQGRVMLIAPTVVNKGTVTAPDGQVIAAAGTKVYLRSASAEDANVRGLLIEVDSPAGLSNFETPNLDVTDGMLDGHAVSLVSASEDKLGHVTNLGELSTPRGNVTMVGYAVNQQGIARATTSVVANGSVYLMAKDTKTGSPAANNMGSSRGGRVLLSGNSLTEVLPDAGDGTTVLDGSTGDGLTQASLVRVQGQDIRMAKDATILAPSGEVKFEALDDPSSLRQYSPFTTANALASDSARIHIASGARIDVAGLEKVQVSAARNSMEVELRGDELKDTPVNRQGPLRGEKVYVDIDRALTNANAGKFTLIAQDSLESYQAKLERTVAERSTTGGAVVFQSQGEVILESGAVVNLSGGSVQYTPASVKTTLLTSGGKLVDIADANAETRYDGIATRYVIDYGRWNRKEVIDLGQSFRYEAGYTDGKNAGSLDVIGMKAAVMQAEVRGRTTVGERQRNMGLPPKGARVTLGSDTVRESGRNDYKLNQRVAVSSAGAILPAGFKFGDVLPLGLKDTLVVNPALLGQDKVATLEIFSNQAAEVREALRTPQGGGVHIAANGLTILADIEAGSGTINLAARNNVMSVIPHLKLLVGDGVTLSARGAWVNELPTSSGGESLLPLIDGGKVLLAADVSSAAGIYEAQGTIELGQSTRVDVTSGGQVRADGKLIGGKGGDIELSAFELKGVDRNLAGYATGKGGKIALTSHRILIGGNPDSAAGTLNLDAGFFGRGGFADFSLTALDKLTVAEGMVITPTVVSLDVKPEYVLNPSGSQVENFTQQVRREDGMRQAANLIFAAKQSGVGTGDIVIGAGAHIQTDPKASIKLEARNKINIEGELVAHGGTISATLDRSSGAVVNSSINRNPIWLGKKALLDVAGIARTYLDGRGLVRGEVLAGGTVNLSAKTGYVVSESGSRIDVSGAAPVRLDILNETGGLGRVVGSDAGTLNVFAEEGMLLDGTLAAQAGSASNRGGTFSATLSKNARQEGQTTFDSQNRVLSLAQTLAPQTTGLNPDDAIPDASPVRARLAAGMLEQAGFDRIALSSRDAIQLEDGLNIGAERALPFREVKLDAARIETTGGDAAIKADVVRMGNYDGYRLGGDAAYTSSGRLKADARLLELAGNLRLRGMAYAELTGTEAVRLSGTFPALVPARPSARLESAADLIFHGAVVAPSTYSQVNILAPGKTVSFTRTTDAPTPPISAQSSLTIDAKHIVQDGNVWAPLGQLAFNASESLVFTNGSLTSVAAAAGSLFPFGKTRNGREWVIDIDSSKVPSGQIVQGELAGKAVRVSGKSVDMQARAKIDLAGGGDLQAYEFTVGPGGSRDILADKNTYAILPGFTGGFAPADTQEGFDRTSGDAVYLTGVPGLKDGVYTLLPAHYALLPGAYAVKLNNSGREVLPQQAYARQDGVHVAAGYVTDTRGGAPRDTLWQGVQVLTQEQVRARSEFTLTRASEFFADGRNRPQDAGLLSISTTGIGADALKLDAFYSFTAAPGGRGGQVDISALKLAVTSGTPTGLDPDAVVLDASRLSALGAESLLIGGTRSASGDTTTLTVGAETMTLANGAAHTLKAAEIMLAAKDTLTLKAGSAIDAQGEEGDAGAYETAGNGAFVRAASTSAGFARTGSPNQTKGTLIGEPGSQITAADSITLDATKKNDYKGTLIFSKNGRSVAGNLGVGAERVNFGAAPATAQGTTYSQAELNAFSGLKRLALSSYTTFDLYGGVKVGGLDADGKPTLQNLTLQGAGLAGIANAGKTAQLNAENLTLSNPQDSTFTPSGALGSGALAVTADTLTLGKGDKAIQGFGSIDITTNELVGSGIGALATTAPVTLNVARIRGERGADQTFTSSSTFKVAQHTADRVLSPVIALGAKWALKGTAVDFDSLAELPSGTFKLTATAPGAHVTLKENARVDVAGRNVAFFDVTKPSWGGTAEFVSEAGDVNFNAGAEVDVSAAPGGDAGTLIVRAAHGKFNVADGSVKGASPVDADSQRGEGARARIDVKELTTFSSLNTALNSGGLDGERDVRVRTGNVNIAASDTTRALNIRIAADGGALDVAGKLDASGEDAGRIELFAKNDVNILGTASIDALSSDANEDGGDIEIGSRDGFINLPASDPGKGFNVAGGAGGQRGTVLLRTERTATDVKIGSLASNGLGSARSVSVEAVKVYNPGDIGTSDASGNVTLTAANLSTINSNDSAFAANHGTIKSRLGTAANNPNFRILSGVEIRSAGNLTLTQDWNLKDSRAGGEAGVLTLRADGNLKLNSNLSDGFSHATPFSSGTTPANLLADNSWSYRLVGGADGAAVDPLAVVKNAGNVTLAAGKLVRTGTGDIRVAAGGDIKLTDNKAVIYTAGRTASSADNFKNPLTNAYAKFSEQGGDVVLAAQGNIVGAPSAQLFNNWLFRQGRLNADGSAYTVQPAWWVRFDQFQQGVGALGGGDVSLTSGGKIENLSASAPTQARMDSMTPDPAALNKTGGGSARVEAAGDILGGQYYADRGDVELKAGGKVDSGQAVFGKPVYTILALGEAQARVRAQGAVNIHTVLNPHWVVQSSGSSNTVFNVSPSTSNRKTLYSTYAPDSGVSMASLNDKVTLHNIKGSNAVATLSSAFDLLNASYQGTRLVNPDAGLLGQADMLAYLPPTLEATAFQGDILIHDQPAGGSLTMVPAANAKLSLLAHNSVNLNATLVMSDRDPLNIPSAANPGLNPSTVTVPGPGQLHAAIPVHAGDTTPVRIYAVSQDVQGVSAVSSGMETIVNTPKAIQVRAGRDVRNLSIEAQHTNPGDISLVQAARDVVFSSGSRRTDNDRIWVGGPGRLEVTAGRTIDLGTSGGIVTRGGLDNPNLPAGGADIHLAAGVGSSGIDYSGVVDRLVAKLEAGSPDDATLWQARWLTGDDTLTESSALAAVNRVDGLETDAQRTRVREMLFTALRETGRDSNKAESAYAGDYARGYAALELLFPGIGAKNSDGTRHYQGDLDLFASRVKTERGGDIEFLLPGGDLFVGLSNTPDILVNKDNVGNNVLGMVTVADGDIRGFARDDILVNQSRILTVAGGDVLLWSSEGDIDAGKGKKTATAVPPPIVIFDPKTSTFKQELQGAASGSGIGALSTGGTDAGDVDLIAPNGTVNAGDAGIRAGNLNIAAQVVLGADNITVSGTSSGTPVADTSAVSAASSGASNADGGVSSATAALSQGLSEAARSAEELKKFFKPTFISAEVIGHGDCEPGEKPPCPQK